MGSRTILETETLEAAGGIGAAARHVEQIGLDAVGVPDLIIGDGTPALRPSSRWPPPRSPSGWTSGGVCSPFRCARSPGWPRRSRPSSTSRATECTWAWAPEGSQCAVLAGRRGARAGAGAAAPKVLPQLIAGTPTRLADQPDQPVVALAPPAPVPPILVGGNSHAAIRRTVTYGDGWTPSNMTPDQLASGAVKLRELAAEHGRASTPVIAYGTHAVVGNDAAARDARDAFVRSLIDNHGIPPEQAARIPIAGSPAQIADRLAAYAAAGAGSISLSLDGRAWMPNCERIAEARAML